jgi:hypothetical protein
MTPVETTTEIQPSDPVKLGADLLPTMPPPPPPPKKRDPWKVGLALLAFFAFEAFIVWLARR